MKARAAIVGVGVLLSTAGFGMARANATSIAVPAPAGVANSVVVKVGNLASIGDTGATAGSTGGSASAQPISLAGTPLLAGTKTTTKSGHGAALDTGNTALGRVAVAPWSTDVASDHSSSSASLAIASLKGVGDVAVAPSFSFASWTPGKSYSAATSDGAVLHVGNYTIKVLHADSDASGHGKTYIVQLLGSDLLPTNTNGCMLDVGPVATVGCLKGLNGFGSDAEVAQALVGANAPFGRVIAAAATGGVGTSALDTAVKAAEQTRGAVAAPSLMARTGTNALLMIALGMLMVAAGMILRFGSRNLEAMPLTA